MRHIDLFSGIGGFALAATWVWGDEYENVGHSEIEKYPCQVYHRHFPESECLGDITRIDWTRFAGTIDIITGGFPCQPHSVAGKRKGEGDERDLWAECVRALCELRPRFALFENVPGIFTSNGGRFFNRVLSDISASGYDCEWQVLSAAEVGAWHKRERVWIVCHAERGRCNRQSWGRSRQESSDGHLRMEAATIPDCERSWQLQSQGMQQNKWRWTGNGREESAERQVGLCGGADEYTASEGLQDRATKEIQRSKQKQEPKRPNWWAVEPRLGQLVDGLSVALDVADRERAIRVATGVPKRVDQLKALGNAIVPQCAAVIMEAIKEVTA